MLAADAAQSVREMCNIGKQDTEPPRGGSDHHTDTLIVLHVRSRDLAIILFIRHLGADHNTIVTLNARSNASGETR